MSKECPELFSVRYQSIPRKRERMKRSGKSRIRYGVEDVLALSEKALGLLPDRLAKAQ